MAGENDQLSLDEMAADLAATMNFEGAGAPLEKGGAAGDMPMGQATAEGGFTQDAGGQVITAGVEGAVQKGDAKTGSEMTSEPGAQNTNRKTGSAMTSEPGREAGGGAGEGGNLSQSGDGMRARKPGQIGVSGGSTGGGNLSESEDAKMRGRKSGKVGISKAEAFDLGLSKAQYEALMAKGMIKAEEEEDEEGEEEEKGKACKGGEVDVIDLEKSLHALEAVAAGSAIPTTEDRRAQLAKGLEAGTLTEAEMVELADLMKAAVGFDDDDVLAKGGDVEYDDPEEIAALEELDKSFQEQWAEAEADHDTYDVSPYLERLHQQTAASLDQIQDNLQKAITSQGNNQRNFNVQLSKSLKGMAQLARSQGDLIKSLTDRLEVVENQPMPSRGARSVQQAQVLRKGLSSEAGGNGAEYQRAQILDALEQMAMRAGPQGMAPCGERLDRAMALYESSGQMTKSLYNDVTTFIQSSGNGTVIH